MHNCANGCIGCKLQKLLHPTQSLHNSNAFGGTAATPYLRNSNMWTSTSCLGPPKTLGKASQPSLLGGVSPPGCQAEAASHPHQSESAAMMKNVARKPSMANTADEYLGSSPMFRSECDHGSLIIPPITWCDKQKPSSTARCSCRKASELPMPVRGPARSLVVRLSKTSRGLCAKNRSFTCATMALTESTAKMRSLQAASAQRWNEGGYVRVYIFHICIYI